MAFTPMADRVLVKQLSPETRTASGFIIPDALQEKSNRGTVVAVGPGKTTKAGAVVPIAVSVGDTVMYELGSEIPVKVDGEALLIIREENLIAVVN